jgi:hypothetical protein
MPKQNNNNPTTEIAIVAITTHGCIQVYKDKEHDIFEPIRMDTITGMEVISLNVVTPSVPNLLPTELVDSAIRIVKDETTPEKFNNSTTKENMVQLVGKIKNELKKNDTQPQEVEIEFKNKNTEYTNDEEIVAYRQHIDSMYTIYDYSTRFPLNKQFYRANNDTLGKMYDWKIILLSDENEPDLMEELHHNISALRNSKTRKENSIIYLSDIINYLRKKGKKKVIIVDFSCSVIRRGEYGVEPPEERYIRFQEVRKGGKTKRKRVNRKRNNNKRRKYTRKNRK